MKLKIPKRVSHLLKEDYKKIDKKMPSLIKLLAKQGANECWHKKGTFEEHLISVWKMLTLWNQRESLNRCGLFHSAYSNSYVNLSIFKTANRELLTKEIGEEAENLVYEFCTINRQELIFEKLLKQNLTQVPDIITMKHIKTNEYLEIKRDRIVDFLILTMADFPEQWHSWQDEIFENKNGKNYFEGNRPNFLFPGELKPALIMSSISKMGALVKNSANENTALPPIFDDCSSVISEKDELEARDLYWDITVIKRTDQHSNKIIEQLNQVCLLNPFIAEPKILLAQAHLILGNFDHAENESLKALDLLFKWGTQWDKRISWSGWIAWTRVLHNLSQEKSYPKSSFGMLNLGKV
eukprot:gene6607-10770_t